MICFYQIRGLFIAKRGGGLTVKSIKCKRLFLLVVTAALLITAAGCGSGVQGIDYDNKAKVSETEEKTLTAQEKEVLSRPNEVQMTMSFTYDMKELKDEKVVDIIRFNKERYYSVATVENGRYLFLLYSGDTEKEAEENGENLIVVDGYLASGFADKEDFRDFGKGMTKEEVLSLDLNSYVFSEDDSYHRFSDKSILSVRYELNDAGQYVVSDYEYYYPGDERESVIEYLLSEDLELISQKSEAETDKKER